MAKGFNYKGLGNFLTDLARKCADTSTTDAIMKQVLYDGADVFANALRASAREHHLTGEMERSINLEQMRLDNGAWYTKLGFAGYDKETDQPNALKAAAIESGTSHIKKDPFIRPALKKAEPAARAAMDAKLFELIGEIMED